CDLVLVEGYKREAHRKIEVRRLAAKDTAPRTAVDPAIVAVAADHAITGERVPVFSLDDIDAIAGFVETLLGLKQS
ncbi:MAG: molybdopterin-guanine dinucleotide biosynthesis protein B, partial [Rhizobiaceae bacterium]